MRRFLPFAALLGVALLLGCQDVGTGVVASDGPGPQFAKKNCKGTDHPPPCGKDDGDPPPPPEDAAYTVTHPIGDLVVGEIDDAAHNGGKKGKSVGYGNVHNFESITFSDAFIAALKSENLISFDDDQIQNCFGAGSFDHLGSFRQGKENKATGTYFIKAFGPDGKTEIAYSLEVFGTFDADGAFAPGSGEATELEWMGGLLHVEGEGVGCVGGGGKHGPQKAVTVTGTVLIVPTPPQAP